MTGKKVVIVGSFPPNENSLVKGGVRRACELLERSQYFAEFQVDLLDSTQTSYPAPKLFTRLGTSFRRFFNFVLLLRSRSPDLVLLFTTNGLSFVEKSMMALFARTMGSKAVIFPRGSGVLSGHPVINRFGVLLAKIPNMIIFQGDEVSKYFQVHYGLPRTRMRVIENWTATDELLRIGELRAYPSQEDVQILFVGWLEKDKGTEALEAVVRRMFDSGISFTLHLVGDGSQRLCLLEKLQDLILVDKVIFHSWVASNQLMALYAESDIFFFPSRREGMPNALIEAMSTGLVPVTTPVGNISSIVDTGRNGFLCAVDDADEMFSALDQLIRDPGLLQQLSASARQTAKSRFSTQANIQKLIDVTSEVVANPSNG